VDFTTTIVRRELLDLVINNGSVRFFVATSAVPTWEKATNVETWPESFIVKVVKPEQK
jgi:hypothetical protein